MINLSLLSKHLLRRTVQLDLRLKTYQGGKVEMICTCTSIEMEYLGFNSGFKVL